MTQFVRKNFTNENKWIHYEGRFVARMRTPGGGTFITFLIKNFTVEEYFKELETSPPLTILMKKGYLLPHIQKWLKQGGYSVDTAGYKVFLNDQVRKLNRTVLKTETQGA